LRGPAASLQGEHIAAEPIRPEVPLEARAQRRRPGAKGTCALLAARERQQPRAGEPGAIEVALDFAQRDRRRGERPVGVGDRDARVFPALIDQAIAVGYAVIEITVAVAVAEA